MPRRSIRRALMVLLLAVGMLVSCGQSATPSGAPTTAPTAGALAPAVGTTAPTAGAPPTPVRSPPASGVSSSPAPTASGAATRAVPATPTPPSSPSPIPTVASGAAATLPPPAACYFEAVRAGNAAGVAACFTPDGVVVDVGRRIEGQAAIDRWAAAEVIGGRYEILEVTPRPDGARLIVRFAPKGAASGFQAAYTFTFVGGKIALADLQYA